MDTVIPPATQVDNHGINLPEHFKDLAAVVEKAKPSFPQMENGFMPLTSFDPHKPYEDLQRYLDEYARWLRENKLSPEQYAAALSDAFEAAGKRCVKHYEERFEDWRKRCEERIADLTGFHQEKERLAKTLSDERVNILNGKIRELEEIRDKLREKNGEFEEQHRNDVENRLKIQGEYNEKILELTREAAKARLERLDDERGHLDEEKRQLRDEQRELAVAKRDWLSSLADKIRSLDVSKNLFK